MVAALEASKALNRPVMVHCEEPDLVRGGAMNAGPVAERLGIPGSPDIAEEVILARDLTLAAATGGWLFACHTTTARGVALSARPRRAASASPPRSRRTTSRSPTSGSRGAAASGGRPTPGRGARPPTRTRRLIRRSAPGPISRRWWQGCATARSTRSAPTTRRTPPSDKDVGYDKAAFGMLAFEVALPTLLSLVRAGALDLPTIIRKLTVAPAAVLGDLLPAGAGTLAVGAPADVTVFDTERALDRHARGAALGQQEHAAPWSDGPGAGDAHLVGGDVRYRA